MSLLVITNVFYKEHRFVLKSINLKVEEGSISYLIGSSGSGKSTLLRLIAGLAQPSAGEIWSDGVLLSDTKKIVEPENRKIGIIFQHASLFPHKTALENITIAISNSSLRSQKKEIALSLLELVGMHKYSDYLPSMLSGGQQQLITIARALAQNPSLLLLDEPFSNLDTILKKEIREKLLSIIRKKKLTTIIVTHDPEEALSNADTIHVMRDGEIIRSATPREIYYQPDDFKMASFFGSLNLLPGNLEGNFFNTVFGKIFLSSPLKSHQALYCRPEALSIDKNGVKAVVIEVQFFNQIVKIMIDNNYYWVKHPIALLPEKGDIIYVTLADNQVLTLNI